MTGELKTFSQVRERARLFESLREERSGGYEVRAVKVDSVDSTDRDEIKRLGNQVRELEYRLRESGGRQVERHGQVGRPMVRCYRCGKIGHISRWCKTEIHLNGNPSQ